MAAVEAEDPGTPGGGMPFSVSGRITFDNFPLLRAEGERHIASGPHAVFNLAELAEGTSVAVALLMAWFRHAHHLDKTVAFEHVPESLLNIIEVSGLADVLPVSSGVPAAAPAGPTEPPQPDRG